MFLGILNEKEGKNFLELATIAMNVGSDVEEALYCKGWYSYHT